MRKLAAMGLHAGGTSTRWSVFAAPWGPAVRRPRAGRRAVTVWCWDSSYFGRCDRVETREPALTSVTISRPSRSHLRTICITDVAGRCTRDLTRSGGVLRASVLRLRTNAGRVRISVVSRNAGCGRSQRSVCQRIVRARGSVYFACGEGISGRSSCDAQRAWNRLMTAPKSLLINNLNDRRLSCP